MSDRLPRILHRAAKHLAALLEQEYEIPRKECESCRRAVTVMKVQEIVVKKT